MVDAFKRLLKFVILLRPSFFFRTYCHVQAVLLLKTKILRTVASALKPHQLSETSRRVRIEELDAILDEAANLRSFLDNHPLRLRYFQALQSYFGKERFDQSSYAAILDQVEMVDEAAPGFAKRAWSKDVPPISFEIETSDKTSGHNVNLTLWRLYRNSWIQKLHLNTKCLKRNSDNKTLHFYAKKVLVDSIKKSWAYEDYLTSLKDGNSKPPTKKQKKILKNSFYSDLKKNKELIAVASLYLHEYLCSPKNKAFYELTDADLILGYLRSLRANPRRILLKVGLPIPNAFASVIKDLIPATEALLKENGMFPQHMIQSKNGKWMGKTGSRSANYVTRSVRPFHSLWCGVVGRDCMAGDPGSLPTLNPERWSLCFIQNSVTIFIEVNGKYQGMARVVPVQHLIGEVYGSLEIWMPLMPKDVIVNGQCGVLLDHWLPRFIAAMPSTFNRLIVSQSRQVDNSRVKEALWRNAAFLEGAQLGEAEEFSLVDPVFNEIAEAAQTFRLGAKWTGKPVCDAMMIDAKFLTTLKALPNGCGFLEKPEHLKPQLP
jgi:hypothetical protein